MVYILMACIVMTYIVMAYIVMVLRTKAGQYVGPKGAQIFNGRSGIWHLHYARLAHSLMPRNTDCDPLGCVGVRQCKKPRQSNSFRLR